MKKTYSKPRVYAESFALTEHISTGCAYPTNHYDCAITEPVGKDGNYRTLFGYTGCDPDMGMIWELAGVTPSYDNLGALNTEGGSLCYNSFSDLSILVTS